MSDGNRDADTPSCPECGSMRSPHKRGCAVAAYVEGCRHVGEFTVKYVEEVEAERDQLRAQLDEWIQASWEKGGTDVAFDHEAVIAAQDRAAKEWAQRCGELAKENAQLRVGESLLQTDCDLLHAEVDQLRAMLTRTVSALSDVLSYAGWGNPDSACEEARASLAEVRRVLGA